MTGKIVNLHRAPRWRLTFEFVPPDGEPNTLYLRTGVAMGPAGWDVAAGLIRDLTYEVGEFRAQDEFLEGIGP